MEHGKEISIKQSQSAQILMEKLQVEATFRGQIDPVFILMFLSICKYDVEKTKEKIIDYYTLKKQHPKLMKAADFLDERNLAIVNQGIVIVDVAQTNSESPMVLVVNFSRVKGRLDLYEGANLLLNGSMNAILDSPRAQKFGGIVIFDVGNLPYHILFQFTPVFLQQAIKCLLSIWGDLLQQIHAINAGMLIMATVNACRLILPNHLNKILYVHSGSYECLKGFLSEENLPEEYGGTNGTIEENNNSLVRVLLKWRDFMVETDKCELADH